MKPFNKEVENKLEQKKTELESQARESEVSAASSRALIAKQIRRENQEAIDLANKIMVLMLFQVVWCDKDRKLSVFNNQKIKNLLYPMATAITKSTIIQTKNPDRTLHFILQVAEYLSDKLIETAPGDVHMDVYKGNEVNPLFGWFFKKKASLKKSNIEKEVLDYSRISCSLDEERIRENLSCSEKKIRKMQYLKTIIDEIILKSVFGDGQKTHRRILDPNARIDDKSAHELRLKLYECFAGIHFDINLISAMKWNSSHLNITDYLKKISQNYEVIPEINFATVKENIIAEIQQTLIIRGKEQETVYFTLTDSSLFRMGQRLSTDIQIERDRKRRNSVTLPVPDNLEAEASETRRNSLPVNYTIPNQPCIDPKALNLIDAIFSLPNVVTALSYSNPFTEQLPISQASEAGMNEANRLVKK